MEAIFRRPQCDDGMMPGLRHCIQAVCQIFRGAVGCLSGLSSCRRIWWKILDLEISSFRWNLGANYGNNKGPEGIFVAVKARSTLPRAKGIFYFLSFDEIWMIIRYHRFFACTLPVRNRQQEIVQECNNPLIWVCNDTFYVLQVICNYRNCNDFHYVLHIP